MNKILIMHANTKSANILSFFIRGLPMRRDHRQRVLDYIDELRQEAAWQQQKHESSN